MSSPYAGDYVRYAWQLLSGYRSQSALRAHLQRIADVGAYLDLSSIPTILDLGNGQLRPQHSLLTGEGYPTFGVDLANSPSHDLGSVGYRVARTVFGWWL